DVVVVDRTSDEPLPGRPGVGPVLDAPQPSVADGLQRIGHGERDTLAVRLVGLGVLGGPPDARADALAGGRDPGPTAGIARPDQAPVPGWLPGRAGLAVIVDRHGPGRSLRLPARHRDEEGDPVAPIREPAAVLHHAVDVQRGLKIDL